MKIVRSIFIVVIGVLWLGSIVPHLYASTPVSAGDNYAIEHYHINQGTAWMFGVDNDMRQSNIGEGVIGIVLASNPEKPLYALFQGYLFVRLLEPVLPDYQYDISEIFAEEYEGGTSLFEEIWHNDPDPFFYWSIKVPGLDVLGYSVAFNELPDEFVDVTDGEYQTPDFYLDDGQHTFYVIAKNTEGNFGAPGSFDIWVDTARPQLGNMLPENGGTVNQVRPSIQAILFDATSGINPSSNSVYDYNGI